MNNSLFDVGLCNQLVGEWLQVAWFVHFRNLYESPLAWLRWLAFQIDHNILLFSQTPEIIVLLESVEEILSAGGVRHVLHSHVDLLRDDPSADTLVDDHAHCVFGHVVHSASLAVVEFMRQTLLERAITLDVDNIASSVDFEKGGQLLHTVVSEAPGEEVTRTTSITLWISHVSIY